MKCKSKANWQRRRMINCWSTRYDCTHVERLCTTKKCQSEGHSLIVLYTTYIIAATLIDIVAAHIIAPNVGFTSFSILQWKHTVSDAIWCWHSNNTLIYTHIHIIVCELTLNSISAVMKLLVTLSLSSKPENFVLLILRYHVIVRVLVNTAGIHALTTVGHLRTIHFHPHVYWCHL